MTHEIMTLTQAETESEQQKIHSGKLTLNIHTDERIFSVLRSGWEALAWQSDQMLCMSPGWAASWWKHFGRHKDRSLYVMTVHDDQKLVGIFPFYRGVTTWGGITLQKRLQLIGSGGNANEQLGFSDDYGISDFLDLIVHPDYKTHIAKLFVNLLASSEFADHKISFHQVRDDSYVKQTLCPLLENTERVMQTELSDTCPYITLEGIENLNDYIKESKSNARRRFRQTMRAQGSDKEYIIEDPAGLDDAEQMLDKLMELHQDKWNAKGYPGAFRDERFRAFFKEISVAAYSDKRLWIKQAVDARGVCAVRMLLMYNGRYYDYMSGYDENSPSTKYRPGIGLLLNLIEDSFKQPIKSIELLRGDEGYKSDFTQLAMKNWKITIPEVRQQNTGWGMPAKISHFGSFFHKYVMREKTLLKIQYERVGVLHMTSGYFHFRLHGLKNKIKRIQQN